MEWQVRNWLFTGWASGDHIVEQHVHNLDVMNWAFGTHPVKCVGMGGRAARSELGAAIGAFTKEIAASKGGSADVLRRIEEAGLDPWARQNLLRFVDERGCVAPIRCENGHISQAQERQHNAVQLLRLAGGRQRHRQFAEQAPGIAFHEPDRPEHRHQHRGGRDHREAPPRRAAPRGLQRAPRNHAPGSG